MDGGGDGEEDVHDGRRHGLCGAAGYAERCCPGGPGFLPGGPLASPTRRIITPSPRGGLLLWSRPHEETETCKNPFGSRSAAPSPRPPSGCPPRSQPPAIPPP